MSKFSKFLTSCFLIFLISFNNVLSVHKTAKYFTKNLNESKFIKKVQKANKSKLMTSDSEYYECSNTGGTFDVTDSDFQVVETAANIVNQILIPALNAINASPIFCMGKFKGSTLQSLPQTVNAECGRMPVNGDFVYFAISFVAYNVVCGEEPETMGGCLIADISSGTLGVIFNGNIIKCGMTLTGAGATLKPFMEFVGALGLGISLNRKWEKTLTVAKPDGNNIKVVDVTSLGHFTFVLNVGLPDFKLGKKNLKEFFSLNATTTVLVDLGNVASNVATAISSLNSVNSCENSANTIQSIKNSGAELTIVAEGFLTIKLNDLTRGFFPDLDIELGEASFVASLGGGNTGLPAGVYLYFKSNVLQAILDVFEYLFNYYLSIISDKFNISMPDLSGAEMSLGLFFSESKVGFVFNFSAGEFRCLYDFDKKKGGCKYIDHFFTMIVGAIVDAIVAVGEFFEEVGETICNLATSAYRTLDNLADRAGEAIENYANEKIEQAEKAVSFLFYFNFLYFPFHFYY